jgi:hypothetical protein
MIDHKENVLCSSCGWVFEYIPGVGAHSLPEEVRRHGAFFKPREKTGWDYISDNPLGYPPDTDWMEPEYKGCMGEFARCCLYQAIVLIIVLGCLYVIYLNWG